jgi:hypothetical protein
MALGGLIIGALVVLILAALFGWVIFKIVLVAAIGLAFIAFLVVIAIIIAIVIAVFRML